jgi:hypothetical protein
MMVLILMKRMIDIKNRLTHVIYVLGIYPMLITKIYTNDEVREIGDFLDTLIRELPEAGQDVERSSSHPLPVNLYAPSPASDRSSQKGTVFYYATDNMRSPFVAVFGHWPAKSALIRSLHSATKLGSRKAVQCEIDNNNASTRHMFMYWRSVKEMLWTHKSPDLIMFYPMLLQWLRTHRYSVIRLQKVVKKRGPRKLLKN